MDKKKRLIIIYISAAVLIVAAAFSFVLLRINDTRGERGVPVYFYNASAGTLESERHGAASVSLEPQALFDETVAAFFNAPRSPQLIRPWPEAEGFLLSYKMDSGTLIADFSSAYSAMPPTDEALFRAAFIKTMTGLPAVTDVRILSEGAEVQILPEWIVTEDDAGHFSREDYEISPTILPNKISSREFILYFVNDTMDGLVRRVHTSDQVDMDQEEMYIINQIIEGQSAEGVYAAIPAETKVTIDLDQESGTCYVNLSSEIGRFSGSPELANLMLYSIVNSLTENLANVRRVQFQIDSQMVEQFNGVTGINQALEKNEDLVVR